MQLIIKILTEENQLPWHLPDQLAENIQPNRKSATPLKLFSS